MHLPEFKIAVLIPTRARPMGLHTAIFSLFDLAAEPNTIQLLLGFDRDDAIGLTYFQETLQPQLDDREINYTVLTFDRMGYIGINNYYNKLATHTDSDWLFAFNDDACMTTKNWDIEITQHTGQFNLLKVHTHNEHPYSIFPIWPRSWYNLFGHCSRHQMIDAELSQIAYLLDIVKIVDIAVTHARPDLNQGAGDATHNERVLLEGNPAHPQDFHNFQVVQQRLIDNETVAAHMENLGLDTTFYRNVLAGKQDPWQQLKVNDVHNQMTQIAASSS